MEKGGGRCGEAGRLLDLWHNGRGASYPTGEYAEEVFRKEVVRVIRDHDAAGDAPLFLNYNMHQPHEPMQIPVEYLNYQAGQAAVLAGMVAYMDETIGHLEFELRRAGMWESTLLVFTSDNGGANANGGTANNFPLRGAKWSGFDGGIRVPAFVSGGFVPQEARGKKETGLSHVADWYATFAFLAGADARDDRAAAAGLPAPDSINMWPGLSAPRRSADAGVGGNAIGRTEILIGHDILILGRHKLMTGTHIYPYTTTEQYPVDSQAKVGTGEMDCGDDGCLFDIYADEAEAFNLADSRPAVRQLMLDRLNALRGTKLHRVRGPVSPAGCVAGVSRGGVWGPFLRLSELGELPNPRVADLERLAFGPASVVDAGAGIGLASREEVAAGLTQGIFVDATRPYPILTRSIAVPASVALQLTTPTATTAAVVEFAPHRAGMDCSGGDIESILPCSWEDCQASCGANAGCTGVSFRNSHCVTKALDVASCEPVDFHGWVFFARPAVSAGSASHTVHTSAVDTAEVATAAATVEVSATIAADTGAAVESTLGSTTVEPIDMVYRPHRAGMDCPGGDIESILPCSWEDCQASCGANAGCTGVSFKGSHCVTKALDVASCEPVDFHGWVFFAKPRAANPATAEASSSLAPTTAAATVATTDSATLAPTGPTHQQGPPARGSTTRYHRLHATTKSRTGGFYAPVIAGHDCSGGDLLSYLPASLSQCGVHCDLDRDCTGFSYKNDHCITKGVDVAACEPGTFHGWVFYARSNADENPTTLSQRRVTASPSEPVTRSSTAVTCDELRWPFRHGNNDVCGASRVSGQCHLVATHSEAYAICDAAGARICNADELQADAARGSGCQLDSQLVWTSSTCGDDPSHVLIAMGRSSLVHPRCFDTAAATRTAGVRCCSERHRTHATRGLQYADNFDGMASGDEMSPEQTRTVPPGSKTAVVGALFGVTVALLMLAGGVAVRGSRKLRAARWMTTATGNRHNTVPSEVTSTAVGSWDDFDSVSTGKTQDTTVDIGIANPNEIMVLADQADAFYAERYPRPTLSEATIAEYGAVYRIIGANGDIWEV